MHKIPTKKAALTPDTEGALEGAFAIPLPQMIAKLNALLSKEYNSWLTYVHYAQMVRGPYREELADIFKEHADEELKHVDVLSRRIVALGGVTTTKIGEVPTAGTLEEMIKTLVRQEQEAIKAYRDAMRDVGQNEGTRQVLETIIEKEQEHTDELWLLLPNAPINPVAMITAKLAKIGATYDVDSRVMPRLNAFLDSLERAVDAALDEEKANTKGSPYLVRVLRDDGYKTLYEVAKFEEGKQPSAVYHVINKKDRNVWACSCTGARQWGKCHHVPMVKAWDKAGRKVHPAFSGNVGVEFKKLMDSLRNQTTDPLKSSRRTKPKKKNVNPKIHKPVTVEKPKMEPGIKKVDKREVHGPVKMVKGPKYRLKPTV